jgi:DNA helicase INO80
VSATCLLIFHAQVYRYTLAGYQARVEQKSKIALNAANQARKPYVRSAKTIKDTQAKGKRLMREMLQTWKKNEREERDVRKREQKEAVDRARVEDEKREAARQARKLEFLISQTELYSHFVGNKLKTAEIEGETVAEVPMGAEFENEEGQALVDINYDDDDETNLYRHASRNAQGAIAAAIAKAATFDKESALERKTNEAIKLAKAQAHVRDDATPEADVGEGGGTNLLDRRCRRSVGEFGLTPGSGLGRT